MFIWKVKCDYLKPSVKSEREKPSGKKDVEKAFPIDSHETRELLVETRCPDLSDFYPILLKRVIGINEDKAYEWELCVQSVEYLGDT